MSKISVIIPSRQEPYLQATINDAFAKCSGDIEVIAVLDGGRWPDPPIEMREGLTIIRRNESQGMRPAINAAAAVATGDFLLKCDAHVMFDKGFDEVLKDSCGEQTIVVPKRKRLDPKTWSLTDTHKHDIVYEYVSFPDNPSDWGGPGLNGREWRERAKERAHIEVDDNIAFQGSCWMARREYFHALELMDSANYGPFWNEAQEISFKAWLSGGKVLTDKRTWYAHWHKGKENGRGYFLGKSWLTQGATFTKRWIHNDAWAKQTLPFHWLIDKFMPMPGWSATWAEQLNYNYNWTPKPQNITSSHSVGL
jgi:glycosyltransferase involved in cell wall biosynthesis